jgi:uncharacterized phage-associated protein
MSEIMTFSSMNEFHVSSKLGNIMVFLAKKIPHLYITKMLNLLYIIDEKSIETYGVPQTWLEYKVWKKGPVANDVYENISRNGASLFTNYIVVDYIKVEGKEDKIKISPIAEFNSDKFSDNDIELLENVVAEYGGKSASELIEILHKENSLWHNIYVKENLKERFDNYATTNISIDLTDKIKADDYKMWLYNNSKEALNF